MKHFFFIHICRWGKHISIYIGRTQEYNNPMCTSPNPNFCSRQSHGFSEAAVKDRVVLLVLIYHSVQNDQCMHASAHQTHGGMLPPPKKFVRRSMQAAATDFNRFNHCYNDASFDVYIEDIPHLNELTLNEQRDYELLMTNFN